MNTKELLEAFKLVFEVMKMGFDFLFTPPVLYITILVIGPSIIGGIIAIFKGIIDKR